MVVVFAVNPIFGLPLIGRYVRTPSVLLAIFFGVALAGWALLEDGREKRIWQGLAVLAAVVFCIFIPQNVNQIDYQREVLHRNAKLYADLQDGGGAPVVPPPRQPAAPIFAADHRPMPHLRWWLDGDPGSVATVEGAASKRDGAAAARPQAQRPQPAVLQGELPEGPAAGGRHERLRQPLVAVVRAPGC